VIVDSGLYQDGRRVEGRLALEHVPAACRRPDSFVWLGLYEPNEEEFESVRLAFNLHELAVEDAVCAHQRPKLEQLKREVLELRQSANLTRVSVRQNEDMRKISAWVAIATVPTMVAGIYGMNFEHMPELDWVGGYPVVLGTMGLACGLLHRFFRRSGWL
jgi:Mg2+ and Co2+ transporter CorA